MARGKGKRRTWRGCAFIIVSSRKYSSLVVSYLVAGVSPSFLSLFVSPFQRSCLTSFHRLFDRLANKHIAARRWKIVLSTFPIRLKVQNERAYVSLLLSFLKKRSNELSNHSIPKYEIKTKRKITFSSAKEIERQHDAFPLPSPLD